MLRLTKNNISPGRPSCRDAVTSLTIRSKRIPSEDHLCMGLQIPRPDQNRAGGLRRIHEYRPHAPVPQFGLGHGWRPQPGGNTQANPQEDLLRAMNRNGGPGDWRAKVGWSDRLACL